MGFRNYWNNLGLKSSAFCYDENQNFLNMISSLLEDTSLWKSSNPNPNTVKKLHELFINSSPIQLLASRQIISQKLRCLLSTTNLESQEQVNLTRNLADNGFALYFLDLDFDSINKRIYSLEGRVSHSPSAGGELSGFSQNLQRFAVGAESSLPHVPELFYIFNNDTIVGTVASFLGCQPTIVEIATVYTNESKENLHAQAFHRDINDFGWVTVFIYHDDICTQNGPHLFLSGSHKLENYPNSRAGMPKFTVDYGYDNCYLNYFGDPVEFNGPRGTVIIEDSIGIHAGKRVQNGSRMISWCVYAMTPSLFNFYSSDQRKSPITWSDLKHTPSETEKYRWRLYIE
jgi:hypothetical protein